jgi:phospholipase C
MAFRQPDPANTANVPTEVLLPFHLDTSQINAACTHDITHARVPQHQSWNNGAMDGFVTSHLPIDSNDAVLSMGYYTRADIPYYYALADGFTICDNYFCSVMGPTEKWRTDFADPRGKPRSDVRTSNIYNDARAAAGSGNFLESLLIA